jgi:aspartyl aminopeptidase
VYHFSNVLELVKITFFFLPFFRLSTNTGIRAVDIGMPQLSMHSIREMMGIRDLSYAYSLFRLFLSDFRTIDASLSDSN